MHKNSAGNNIARIPVDQSRIHDYHLFCLHVELACVAHSGGFTYRGDGDSIIITLHASAEVTMGDEDTNIRPGDEILVAPEVDSKLFQNVRDVTQVLYQIAAGVVAL